MDSFVTNIEEKLEKKLSTHRYKHTLGVANMAFSLALRHGYDYQKAYLAGILHDCAKVYPYEAQLEECNKRGIILSEHELKNPGALAHAKLGAYLAKHEYGVDDEEILSAISYHTTSKHNMSILDKIIYVSDCAEVSRDDFENANPRLDVIRKTAFEDLDKAYYLASLRLINYLRSMNFEIDPLTLEVNESYRKNYE